MTTSILQTIKTKIGPSADDDTFDNDILTCINTAISVLDQLGVSPPEGFSVEDDSAQWEDYIPDNPKRLSMVKTYIYLKAKVEFDPPTSSVLMQALEKQIAEYEWRICNQSANTTEGGGA